MRCEALTSNNCQCKFSARVTSPNIIGGGPQDDGTNKTWLYGRDVHTCLKHGFKKYQKLINNGFYQPYNKHGYGHVVLDKYITFDEIGNPIEKYDCPDFWKTKDANCQI